MSRQLSVALIALSTLAACGGGGASTSNGGGGGSSGSAQGGATSGGGAGQGGNGHGGDGQGGGAVGPHASVRVADFSRPLLLYLDFCFSTQATPTTSWTGPMLRGTYTSIQNSQISAYVDAPAGTRSVRFVLADSPDCSQTLEGLPDLDLDGPIAEGSRSTLLFGGIGFGAGSPGLEIFRFDDLSDPATGPNSVRIINAALDESPIDIYLYSGFGMQAPCTKVYDDIAYGAAGVAQGLPGGASATGSNGYTKLGTQNLYDLTFASLGYVAHGGGCNSAFGTLYATDMELGQGAWTVFLADEASTHIMCRDDGSAAPVCNAH